MMAGAVKRIMVDVLARLLHLANSNPPAFGRSEFYALKDALLKRYATFDGRDIQRIVKECWGDGWWEGGRRMKCGPTCKRCGGTGVFDVKYFELDRWRMGGYLFHANPTRLYCSDRHAHATIQGRIEHQDYGRKADEALLWLLILTGHWRLLWKESAYCWRYSRAFWPLLNIACLCWFAASIHRRLKANRCYCGRTFRHWFDNTGRLVCRECWNRTSE